MISLIDLKTLRPLMRPQFFEFDGCVFLRGATSPKLYRSFRTGRGKVDRLGMDRTGFEAFENHVHTLNLLAPGPRKPSAAVRRTAEWLGRAIVHVWRSELAGAFPAQRFRIYYARSDEPVIRFHRCYRGETSWLDPKKYTREIAQGRLLVLETKGRPV